MKHLNFRTDHKTLIGERREYSDNLVKCSLENQLLISTLLLSVQMLRKVFYWFSLH